MMKNPGVKGRVVCDHLSKSKLNSKAKKGRLTESTMKQESPVMAPKVRSKAHVKLHSDCVGHAGIGHKLINDNLHFMTTCGSYEEANHSELQSKKFHEPFAASEGDTALLKLCSYTVLPVMKSFKLGSYLVKRAMFSSPSRTYSAMNTDNKFQVIWDTGASVSISP